jgi:hypothetical protein
VTGELVVAHHQLEDPWSRPSVMFWQVFTIYYLGYVDSIAEPNWSFACQHLSHLPPAYLHLQMDRTWLPLAVRSETLMKIRHITVLRITTTNDSEQKSCDFPSFLPLTGSASWTKTSRSLFKLHLALLYCNLSMP